MVDRVLVVVSAAYVVVFALGFDAFALATVDVPCACGPRAREGDATGMLRVRGD